MFLTNNNKKRETIQEWIVKKWTFWHSGVFSWKEEIVPHLLSVSIERKGFSISFENQFLEIAYTDLIHKKEANEVIEHVQHHRYLFDLSKIARVEALCAPNTEHGYWGQPILDLGVLLVPYASESGIVLHTTVTKHRLLANGERSQIAPAATTTTVLASGFVYLGNDDKLHKRGKKAFEDLVRIAGGLRKRTELY